MLVQGPGPPDYLADEDVYVSLSSMLPPPPALPASQPGGHHCTAPPSSLTNTCTTFSLVSTDSIQIDLEVTLWSL